MNRVIYIISLWLLICQQLMAQEFSTPIYFEDAVGNRDTIIIGYDSLATNGIDTIFGEENLISVPRDSVFDVRVIKTVTANYHFDSVTYHTKKQILNKGEECRVYPAEVNIICSHPPVKVTWHNEFFSHDCRKESFITNVPAGGWFDVAGVIYGMKGDSVGLFDEEYGYETLFLGISATFISVDITSPQTPKKENVKIYPNPVTDYCNIKMTSNIEKIESVKVFDMLGSIRYQKTGINKSEFKLNASTFNSGLFYLVVNTYNGEFKTSKIVIE